MGKTQSKPPVVKKRTRRKTPEIYEKNRRREEDWCSLNQLEDYDPPKLQEPSSVKEKGKDRIYTFKETNKKYIVKFTPERNVACVSKIICKEENDTCKDFSYDVEDGYVVGSFNQKSLVIRDVAMGSTKGHCSKAVAYMLKVLMIEANNIEQYPYNGVVFLASGTQCAAVNCYSHAFQMNGYKPDMDEIHTFIEKNAKRTYRVFDNSITFLFRGFLNRRQRRKFNRQAKEITIERLDSDASNFAKLNF